MMHSNQFRVKLLQNSSFLGHMNQQIEVLAKNKQAISAKNN